MSKRKQSLTRTTELLALDLTDALVSEAARAGAPCTTRFDRVGAEIIG